MIPILYKSITLGIVPSDYGVGALTDCLGYTVTETRNGQFEMSMTYSANGIHAEDIEVLSYIKASANYFDNPQLFVVYKVGKVMNGKFTVNARHISYLLSNKLILSGTASSCANACALLEAQASPFTIRTDKTTVGSFRITEPSSVRSWFGGKEGSLLDVFGTGEWKYDNFSAFLYLHRGADRNVTIRNGKNLTELSQDIDIDNLATGVLPFYKDNDGNVTSGSVIPTGLTLEYEKTIAVDFSQDVNVESATPIVTQLETLGTRYVNNNDFVKPTKSITVSIAQEDDFNERIDLCDTVHIYYEALGITAEAECVEVVWNGLAERYEKITFGAVKTNIADTFSQAVKQLENTASKSFTAQAVSRATALITGNLGGYVVLHDSDGNGEPDEILIMNTPDIATASKVWRWNQNGLGYSSTGYSGQYGLAMTSNGEIVADFITSGVLNADVIKAGVIQDAQHNSSIDMTSGQAKLKNLISKNGFFLVDDDDIQRASLRYTNSGGASIYVKQRDDATLDAVRIQDAHTGDTDGGLIALFDGSAGDNTNATVSLRTVKNRGGLLNLGVPDGSKTFVRLGNLNDTGGELWLGDKNSNEFVRLYASANGGSLYLYDENGNPLFSLYNSSGGVFRLYNDDGDNVISLWSPSGNKDGAIYVKDSGGTNNITMFGGDGSITCVSLTQTSSKKVKKNIKKMKDAPDLLKLEAVSFDYKKESLGTDRRGFLAEDVAEILPNLVKMGEGDTPSSIDYIGMIPYIQSILKDHEERLLKLEKKKKEA